MKTSQKWHKVRFGDLLEPSIKVVLKKGLVYDYLPMDLVSSSSKFPKSFEAKIFNGGGSRFENGDTVFARITPCLQNGKIAKVKGLKDGVGFGSTEFFVFRARKEIADPDYVFYVAKTYEIRGPAEKSMTGASGRQRADKGVTEDIIVNVPNIGTQKQIADVLSAYDDLIENNNCRIKILEETAQKIYKEWFVNFRFPGHEKVKMVDSATEFGMIPEGWEVKEIKEIGNVITGKTPSTTDEYNFGEHMPFIKTPDLHDSIFCISTNQKLSEKGANSQLKKTLPKDSIVVSCIGTLGIVGITTENSQTNQQINAVVLKDIRHREYLYFLITNLKEHLKNLGANGATMGNVNKDKFETIEILFPSTVIISEFHDDVGNIFEQIKALSYQNQNLKKSRNLLIPQLVSGKLEIK